MKLLFVLKKIGVGGGVPTTLTNRLNYLSEHTDFELHVVTELENNKKALSKINSKVKFHVLDLNDILIKKRLPLFAYFLLIEEVKIKYQEFIDVLKPDIISTFNHGYNKDIIPFINTSALKIIELRGSYASSSSLSNKDLKNSVINLFRKNTEVLQNRYDYAITITEEDTLDRTYLKINKKFIYNPHKIPDAISEFKNRNNTIIAAGTLTHNKNFKDLIETANLIKKNLKGWEIHIYGEGIQEAYLNRLISQYALEKIVFLKGFSYDMSVNYNNAKLLISTSLSEGLPNTLIEALSFKTPVISYNCKTGPKEIVKDNINGYLIDFDHKILAQKIKKLVENENLLNEFSENTFLSLKKFDFDKIMNEWVSFYNNITDKE